MEKVCIEYIYNRCFSACTCRFVRLKIRCHACLNRHTTMWDHKPETLNKTTQNRRQENHWNTLFFAFVNQCDAVRSHQIQRLCKPVTSWSDTMFLTFSSRKWLPTIYKLFILHPGRWRYCTFTMVVRRQSNQKKKNVNEIIYLKTKKAFASSTKRTRRNIKNEVWNTPESHPRSLLTGFVLVTYLFMGFMCSGMF